MIRRKRAVVFGTGFIFHEIRRYILGEFDIVGIIDNNKNKIGTELDGIIINDPENINRYKFDVVILAASHIVPMAKQLAELGVPVTSLIIGSNFIINQDIVDNTTEIKYYLDKEYNLKCKYKNNDESFITLNLFNKKKLLVSSHSLSTIIGMSDNGGVASFIALSRKYNPTHRGIFLDIGANIGTSSVEATEFDDVTKVVSFEPSSSNYALLMANIFLNKLDKKIEAYNYAVGTVNEFNNLFLSPLCSGDNRLRNDSNIEESYSLFQENNREIERVETIVLDDFIVTNNYDVNYMWIDVQGYEYYVLKGCETYLTENVISVQIEYWPLGLRETNSIGLLNDFLVEHFSFYIDMKDYENGIEKLNKIEDIYSLEQKLKNMGGVAHTDLFLIRNMDNQL